MSIKWDGSRKYFTIEVPVGKTAQFDVNFVGFAIGKRIAVRDVTPGSSPADVGQLTFCPKSNSPAQQTLRFENERSTNRLLALIGFTERDCANPVAYWPQCSNGQPQTVQTTVHSLCSYLDPSPDEIRVGIIVDTTESIPEPSGVIIVVAKDDQVIVSPPQPRVQA